MSDLDYLLPETKKVLLDLAGFNWLQEFTFVGGSGLSLYLHHRLSEDIDLFTWNAELQNEQILESLNNHYGNNFTIQQNTRQQLDLVVNGVNITFFANHWEALRNNSLVTKNLYLADLDLLTAMKINTLFLRAKFRDYYDLYALNLTRYKVSDMYAVIEPLMPGINKRLFQMAMIYTEDVEDDNINHLNPIYTVTKKDIANHFQKEIDHWLFS